MSRLSRHGQIMNMANPVKIPSFPKGPLAKRTISSASPWSTTSEIQIVEARVCTTNSPSGHTTSKWRCIGVDATYWCRIDVNTQIFSNFWKTYLWFRRPSFELSMMHYRIQVQRRGRVKLFKPRPNLPFPYLVIYYRMCQCSDFVMIC